MGMVRMVSLLFRDEEIIHRKGNIVTSVIRHSSRQKAALRRIFLARLGIIVHPLLLHPKLDQRESKDYHKQDP